MLPHTTQTHTVEWKIITTRMYWTVASLCSIFSRAPLHTTRSHVYTISIAVSQNSWTSSSTFLELLAQSKAKHWCCLLLVLRCPQYQRRRSSTHIIPHVVFSHVRHGGPNGREWTYTMWMWKKESISHIMLYRTGHGMHAVRLYVGAATTQQGSQSDMLVDVSCKNLHFCYGEK